MTLIKTQSQRTSIKMAAHKISEKVNDAIVAQCIEH